MHIARVWLGVGLAASLAAGVAGLARAQPATTRPEINAPLPGTPEEIIAFRQANYKWMGDTFGDMKKVIDAGGDVAPLAAKAADMAAWARRIPGMFPVGTETGGPAGHPTKALPAIWTSKSTFDERSVALATQSAKLSTVAATGDKAAFAEQYKAVGATCGACHRDYRAR